MKITAPVAALFLLLVPALASAFSARDYRTTFDTHRSEVLACANGTTGSFVLRMHVMPDGSTEAAQVESADSDAIRAAGACVVTRLANWRFARSSSGAFPRYRLDFTSDAFTIRRLPYRAP